MSTFTQNEIEYLGSGLLGRLATVGPDGTPHVAPVGMSFHNARLDTIDVGGHNLTSALTLEQGITASSSVPHAAATTSAPLCRRGHPGGPRGHCQRTRAQQVGR